MFKVFKEGIVKGMYTVFIVFQNKLFPPPSTENLQLSMNNEKVGFEKGPLKTITPLLNINKNAYLGGPGDGGRFWDLAICT